MDWIEVVEAAYVMDGPLDEWLAGIVAASEPALDAGLGCYAHVYEVHGRALQVLALQCRGPMRGQEEAIRRGSEDAPVDALRVMFDAGIVAGSSLALLEPAGLAEEFERVVMAGTGGQAKEMVGVVANDHAGAGLALAGAYPERHEPGPATVHRWTLATAHIGAALRLRRRLGRAASEPVAVLRPDGRPLHLTEATEGAAERLRAAARAIDKARTREARAEPDALELWAGLVSGRWSLVDRFESDGQRFLVAHENAVEVRDPRGLSATEHLVAERLGTGRTLKEIAYELGVSPSAVSNAASRARRKLGLTSSTELARFFAPSGIRARIARFSLEGESLAVASLPALSAALEGLPPAEREVAMLVLEGHTNESIAALRQTSPRTIANQVASIYRRLGVASRIELAARLSS